MGEVFERLKQEKLREDKIKNSAHVLMGLSISEYLLHKNPQSLEDLNQAIDEMALENAEIIKMYTNSSHISLYPHYIGAKVKYRRILFPRGEVALSIPREHLIMNKIIWTSKKKKDNDTSRSI